MIRNITKTFFSFYIVPLVLLYNVGLEVMGYFMRDPVNYELMSQQSWLWLMIGVILSHIVAIYFLTRRARPLQKRYLWLYLLPVYLFDIAVEVGLIGPWIFIVLAGIGLIFIALTWRVA